MCINVASALRRAADEEQAETAPGPFPDGGCGALARSTWPPLLEHVPHSRHRGALAEAPSKRSWSLPDQGSCRRARGHYQSTLYR